MALTSQQIMSQIQSKGDMPNFKQEVAKAYDAPVLQPIIQERAGLEAQYLPSLYEPFTQWGTGAADMSPAAKMAAIGGSVGRLGSRIGASNTALDFYGAQMGDIVGSMTSAWDRSNQNMWRMYEATYGQEEDARRAAAARGGGVPDFPDFPGGGIPPVGSTVTPGGATASPIGTTPFRATKVAGGLFTGPQTNRLMPRLTLGATTPNTPYQTMGGLTGIRPGFLQTGSLQGTLNRFNLRNL